MLDRSFIRQSAAAAGFDLCGVAPCRHLVRNEQFFRRWLGDGRHASLGYLERNLDKRFDVRRLVEGAQTVVVCAVGYKNGLSDGYPDDFRAKIASYALTADYHATIKGMLGDLFGRLRAAEPALAGRAFVDSAPLVEKQLAVEAGLGWIGRQSLLVTPRFGSFVLLGELVLVPQLLPDHQHQCGSCRRCVEACPTGAVCNDRAIDARRCISCHTIERTPAAEIALDGWIFGCDACQSRCPYNLRAPLHLHPAFDPLFDPLSFPPERWLAMEEAEFRTSAARRSCAAASGASKPMRRKTCAEREGNDCRRCIKKNCSVVEQFFFRYSENPYFLCRFR